MSVRRIIKIVSDVVFVVGLAIAGAFIYFHFSGNKMMSVFVVSSGSMAPGIPTGSLVLSMPKSEYRFGDVVTFFSSTSSKSTTTHRIVGIGNGKIRTAGDANDSPDPGLISEDQIVGKVIFSVPFLGYLAAWAKTPPGFIFLVIVPATIIVYEELRSLVLGIKKKFSKPDQAPINNPAIIVPVFFALLITLGVTISFFIDTEVSVGNSIAASADP